MAEISRNSQKSVKSVPIICPILGYDRSKESESDASVAYSLGYLGTFANTPSASNEVRFGYSEIASYFENLFLDLKITTTEATPLCLRISRDPITMIHTETQNIGIQNFYGSEESIRDTKILKGDGTDYWEIPAGGSLLLRGVDVNKIIGFDDGYFPLMFMFDRDPVDASFNIDRLKVYGTLGLGEGYA
ncbi:MAG: hypothetical protein M0R80_18550 [Proteobacteria bacterium]|jgi:hypothetical protein|nr:hypothetical protein [Pseudomonadota bacterium]